LEDTGGTSMHEDGDQVAWEVEQWEQILSRDPYYEELQTVNRVLERNDYSVVAHIRGDEHRDLLDEDCPEPERVILEIDDLPSNLRENVEAPLFQDMSDFNILYDAKDLSYLEFGLMTEFDESVDLALEFSHLSLEYPTEDRFLRGSDELANY
jgi:hypothetical protein